MTLFETKRGLYISVLILLNLTMTATAFCALTADDDVHIQGHFLEWYFSKDEGGKLETLHILGSEVNLAGDNGLAQEGFGVGSHYVPNRRLNEKLEILEEASSRPMLRYQYDCDGPNIKGLHVMRTMEPLPEEASMRVTWSIENKGDENQWIAPWIKNDIRVDTNSHMDLPTLMGVIAPNREGYYAASRNWTALTNPRLQNTLYIVTHADHTHAFLTTKDEKDHLAGIQVNCVPRFLKPGEIWTTLYRLNVARGLKHVNFACDEFAMQLDCQDGQLIALFSPAKPINNLEIEARIVAKNKRVWKLPRKRFNMSPSQLARCTYDWVPPEAGVYEFMAQLYQGDDPLPLGSDTGSPHGGIDTQFIVGKEVTSAMPAWTDAPHVLDRGARLIKRNLAIDGETKIWFAPSLEKIFREDSASPLGATNPILQVSLAKNESESFQICLRPPVDMMLANVNISASDLIHENGSDRISQNDISLYHVHYHHVPIPSHYEGPTGWWPDALPPLKAFSAEAGRTTPVWVTVYARPGAAPGIYRGSITVSAANGGPWELGLELTIYDFELPTIPTLKTDFGFSMESVSQYASSINASPDRIARGFLENALMHRVTLHELSQMPGISSNYAADLARYEQRLDFLLKSGLSTIHVPANLLDAPEQLRAANAFVKRKSLSNRAFTQLAIEPEEPAWNRILESMEIWEENAPDIPITVSTQGLRPFIPPFLDIWSLHAQVFDTTHNAAILKRASENGEVWWYVNHTPPRPYGNFFLDFAGIEHRILFWQTWALGLRGMQYWNVNYWLDNQNPYDSVLDITPVNGDGILLYPGADGPVNSIRWEIIRDGIEDFDYFTLFMERVRALKGIPGHDTLLKEAADAYNLHDIVPSLVSFTRDPEVLLKKREDIAHMILKMDQVLKRSY
ncbi:MAG: glycoside hydrolase domain-containing protein [Candidatus Hydrogenedentales bacterium]|jgi:hypothetical protein